MGSPSLALSRTAAAVTALIAGTAAAQTPPSTTPAADGSEIQVVTVTATKRLEQAKDVPMAVSAISGADLQASGAVAFTDYASKIPNLSFGYANAGRQGARLFQIRGIFGNDTSALYLGETSIPTSVDPRVMDVERIEVLRGPQGSLFGARSMGGLLKIVPNRPSTGQFSGSAHVGVGSTREGGTSYSLDTTLNIPLSQRAAMRVTAYHLDDAGWIDRLIDPDASLLAKPLATSPVSTSGDERLHKDVNHDKTSGVQVSGRLDVTDWLTISPRLMHQRTRSGGPPYVDNDVSNLVKVRQFDVSETGRDEWTLFNLEASASVGGGEFVSSTSHFKRETLDVEDGTPFMASRFGGRVRTAVDAPSSTALAGSEKITTQEFRWVSDDKSALQFIVGSFFQRTERDSAYLDSIIPGRSPLIGLFGTTTAAGDQFFSLRTTSKTTEVALFGEANYKILPKLVLTAGGRYYDIKTDQTRLDGGVLFTKFGPILAGKAFTLTPYAGTQKGSGFNPRVALSWEQSKELTWYANAAKGYRPGRVNDTKGACTALGVTGVKDSIEADTLWNYEGGAKASLMGGRVVMNVAVFQIDWKNRQTQVGDCGGLGFGIRDNVGAAQSKGAEFDITMTLAGGFGLSAALGYTDARITNVGTATGVAVGDRLANAPRTNASVSMDYSQAIGGNRVGYVRLDSRFVGESISSQKAVRPQYTIFDLRGGVKMGGWDISLFIKNLRDVRANLSDAPELSDSLNLIGIERPRTVGLDVRTRF